MARALAVPRGCGSRKGGGIYLETGMSPYGTPIEELLIDPPLSEKDGGSPNWFRPHRSPILFEKDGAWHVLIWVGKEFYESVWDFIEEVRVAGVSRRVPEHLDFSKLTAKSRMFFVHPTAWTRAETESDPLCFCPKKLHFTLRQEPSCIGGSLYLTPPTLVENKTKWRGLPCGHRYKVCGLAPGDDLPGLVELIAKMQVGPGMFLQTAITGIALVRKHDGSFDPKVAEHVRKAEQIEVFETDA
ncbi:MAG: hypothetical protein HYT87_13120 [Nitrospirae bacterium]|nr:hypothetical protein [Nitrospirota bacterium]